MIRDVSLRDDRQREDEEAEEKDQDVPFAVVFFTPRPMIAPCVRRITQSVLEGL